MTDETSTGTPDGLAGPVDDPVQPVTLDELRVFAARRLAAAKGAFRAVGVSADGGRHDAANVEIEAADFTELTKWQGHVEAWQRVTVILAAALLPWTAVGPVREELAQAGEALKWLPASLGITRTALVAQVEAYEEARDTILAAVQRGLDGAGGGS